MIYFGGKNKYQIHFRSRSSIRLGKCIFLKTTKYRVLFHVFNCFLHAGKKEIQLFFGSRMILIHTHTNISPVFCLLKQAWPHQQNLPNIALCHFQSLERGKYQKQWIMRNRTNNLQYLFLCLQENIKHIGWFLTIFCLMINWCFQNTKVLSKQDQTNLIICLKQGPLSLRKF